MVPNWRNLGVNRFYGKIPPTPLVFNMARVLDVLVINTIFIIILCWCVFLVIRLKHLLEVIGIYFENV